MSELYDLITHGIIPHYISELVQLHLPPIILRSSSGCQLKAPAHSSIKFYGDRYFRFAAAHLWNSLPNSICQAQSQSIFKSRLKTYLFTQYFFVLTRVVRHPITWYFVFFLFFRLSTVSAYFNPIMCKAPRGIRIWRYIKSVFIIIIILSDHYLVYGLHTWKTPKKGVRSINFRCFKDIDNDVFKEDLVNAPWDRVLSCHDVNEAWSLWHSLFMSIINNNNNNNMWTYIAHVSTN